MIKNAKERRYDLESLLDKLDYEIEIIIHKRPILPFLLIFVRLLIVRNETEWDTNWKVCATKRDIIYQKWYKHTFNRFTHNNFSRLNMMI